MDLVRDVLDKPVFDRNGREMGRADAVILEMRNGKPPVVRAIEIGPAVVARRLSPALGRLASVLEDIFCVAENRPIRVAFSQVDVRTDRIVAHLTAGQTGAANIEHRVRHFFRRFAWK